MKIEGGQFGKKGTSGRKDEERVMEGWIWLKYIIYMYENVMMKPIKTYQKKVFVCVHV
jgi:hypothetical protein